MRGHCLCGKVAFEVKLPVQACVNCHCESCRRQCSAPMTTYIAVADYAWHWLSEPAKLYRSSLGVERRFCADCGSPISFRSEKLADVMHFYVATMENPEAFQPSLHVAVEERLAWLPVDDDLPGCVGPDYTRADA